MQRSDDFSLFIISDVPYLLPFGQGIADLKRGVQINDAGVYLWELLSRERTEDELLSLYAAHYEIPDSQLQQLKTDLQQFFHMLNNYGMLRQAEIPAGSNAVSDSCTVPDYSSSAYSDAEPFSGRIFEHDSSNMPVSDCRMHALTNAALSFGNEYADANINAACADTVQRYLAIGGLTLLLCGSASAFSQDFNAFEIFPDSDTVSADAAESSSPADQTIGETGSVLQVSQTITVTDHAPEQRPRSRILLKNRELTVMESDSQYIFLFPAAPGIYESHLTKDGTDARYYCCPPYTESLRQDLFHAIRLSFLYLAQLHDMVVLHSASLLYQGKAWLFSGHSGAGKSTHTALWKELYNVPLINGDLNLLSMENGVPMVHGLPWCGTSEIVDTCSYPLGGIILVKKSLQNHITIPDDSHAQLLVAQHLISPGWTAAMVRKNLRLVAELAPHILICRLHCTKTPEAAETGRKAIDDYLLSADHSFNSSPFGDSISS